MPYLCKFVHCIFLYSNYHRVDCKDNVDHPVKRLLESLKIISYFHFSLVVRLIWLLGLNFTVCQVRWARRVTPWKWVLLDRASRPKEHFFYHLKNWNIFLHFKWYFFDHKICLSVPRNSFNVPTCNKVEETWLWKMIKRFHKNESMNIKSPYWYINW